MPVTIVATPGAANANSYPTLLEAQAWWDTRTFSTGWDALGVSSKQNAALVSATRSIDAALSGRKELMVGKDGFAKAYFRTGPAWTGTPATATQSLAWPRIGMFDLNGNAIEETVVPQALKEAVAELAGAFGLNDRFLDNAAAAQGISSAKAGSVSVSFSGSGAIVKVLPDVIWELLVPSWMTDEIIEGARRVGFEVLT